MIVRFWEYGKTVGDCDGKYSAPRLKDLHEANTAWNQIRTLIWLY
jgi:hypothetical protein